MDKLKLFIDDNREAFEDRTMPLGHSERFSAKLQQRRRGRTWLYSLGAFVAAACIALLVVVHFPNIMERIAPTPTAEAIVTQQEIDELRFYYNMQMTDVLAQMEALYKAEKNPGAAELLEESKRVLTANYQFEETVLPVMPSSEDALFAMNQQYSNSLECMNFMLDKMEVINKNKKNE